LVFSFVGAAPLQQETQEHNAKTDEIPRFLRFNMSFDIQKQRIEEFASEHGWEKTLKLASESARKYHEDSGGVPFGRYIRAKLWTPTLAYIDAMFDADIYLKSRKKAEKQYADIERILKNNIYFTLTVRGNSKEEIQLDNLDFILEKDKDNILRSEEYAIIEDRGIEDYSALGITVYTNTIDILFSSEPLEGEKSEELILHIISSSPRRRVEMSWDIKKEHPREKIKLFPKAGELVSDTPVVYPKDAAARGKTGEAIFLAVVDERGKLGALTLISSSGSDQMDQVARLTIENEWEFDSYESGYDIEISVEYKNPKKEKVDVNLGALDIRGYSKDMALDKIYVSEFFEINYSSGWHVKTKERAGMSELVMFYYKDEYFDEQAGKGANGIKIAVEEDVYFTEAQYYAVDNLKDEPEEYEVLDSGPVELAGIEGHRRTYITKANGEGSQFREITIIDEDNTAYQISFFSPENQVQEYKHHEEKFLSSFSLK